MNKSRIGLQIGVVASAALAGSVFQTSFADEPDAGGLAEIVVTAQRRSQNLESTPVAVAVIGGDELAKAGLTTESDLPLGAPGLQVQTGTGSNILNFVIRGQATDLFSGSRPGVLPYFDEVLVSGAGGSTSFYDLDSVQVLKGPQGTLFGRDSTGGAVLFTTNKPSNDWDGYAQASFGNYGYTHEEGALDIPIAPDVLLARVAGFVEKRDGFQYNEYDGERVGNRNRYGLRGTLEAAPWNGVTNTTVVDYFSANEVNIDAVLWAADPAVAASVPSTLFFSPNVDALFGPGAWNAYLAAHPNANPGGVLAVLAAQKASGPYTVDSAGDNAYQANNLTVSNVTTFDVTDESHLKNIVGFARQQYLNALNPFATPYVVFNSSLDLHNREISDELQWQGKALNDNFDYTAGVYYSNEKSRNITTTFLLDLSPVLPVSTPIYAAILDSTTYAGYAQGTYNLAEVTGVKGLAVTLGARYSDEKVGYEMPPNDTSYAAASADVPIEQTNQDKTYRNVSWIGRIEEQLNDSLLLYTSVRKGFRNGGYNILVRPVVGDGSQGGNGFNQETVTDFEFGSKFESKIGSMPVRLNADIYRTWILNNQRVAYTEQLGQPAGVTVNVPRAAVKGFEADGLILPASWLQLGGAANYTDAKFTNNEVSILGAPPIPFGTYPYAPRWSGNLYAQLNFPVSGNLQLTVRGEEYGQSAFYIGSTGTLVTPINNQLPGYFLTNFRVGLEQPGSGWSVAVNIRNAFNRVYYTGGADAEQLIQLVGANPGLPRMGWVDVRYKF